MLKIRCPESIDPATKTYSNRTNVNNNTTTRREVVNRSKYPSSSSLDRCRKNVLSRQLMVEPKYKSADDDEQSSSEIMTDKLTSSSSENVSEDASSSSPKVKVVAELLKRDVQKTYSCPSSPQQHQLMTNGQEKELLNNVIHLSSLIIAKDLMIGHHHHHPTIKNSSNETTSAIPKKKLPPVDVNWRKKRIQRVSEHAENKQKVLGVIKSAAQLSANKETNNTAANNDGGSLDDTSRINKSSVSRETSAVVDNKINKSSAGVSPPPASLAPPPPCKSPIPRYVKIATSDKRSLSSTTTIKFGGCSDSKDFTVTQKKLSNDNKKSHTNRNNNLSSSVSIDKSASFSSATSSRNNSKVIDKTIVKINGENLPNKTVTAYYHHKYKCLRDVFNLPDDWEFTNSSEMVLPIIECNEKIDRQGKTDEQLQNEKKWLDCDKCWLMHKGGFTSVRILSRSHETGKVGICLESTGEQATVDEDDIELANPSQFDQCEDLVQLPYLNESGSLHTLRQRFGSNLIHTYAGPTMIIINPTVPLSIYSDKVARMFRGCKPEDMPAHIFSVAQTTYREMLSTRKDHSVLFIGRSGSGKTVNYKHVLNYYAMTAASSNKVLNSEKLIAIWTILESFGNCKTALNHNATKFTHLFTLDFDHSGQIASASIQILSFEKWRIVKRPNGEYPFHIIHWLLAGVDGMLRRELLLDQVSPSDQNIFFAPLNKHDEKQKALMEFNRLCACFKMLDFTDAEVKVVFLVLAAIIHLGYADASKTGTSSRWQFNNPAAAQRAAKCLGTSVEDLSHIIFVQGISTPTSSSKTLRSSSASSSPTNGCQKTPVTDDFTGVDALEGFVVGLYTEVFSLVATLINRNITASVNTVNSILLLDYPGFQNSASCGHHQDGATFNDLCHNYLHERLQLLFHYVNLDVPRDKYNQERIDVVTDKEESSPEMVVNLLDNSSSSFIKSSQLDLRQCPSSEKRAPGLLWLLDDIATYQPASEHTFLEKTFSFYNERDDHMLIRKAPGNNHFIIQHCQGTNPVLYRADGWIKICRENPFTKTAITVLQDSDNKDISVLFLNNKGVGLSSSLVALDNSLRRISSIRRNFTAGFKRKSVSLQVKFTADGLVETLRRTKIKFVHCFLPHHDSALVDNKSVTGIVTSSSTFNNHLINVPLLRSQLRGSEILPVVRIYKQGFPKMMPLSEFSRRFNLLCRNNSEESADRRISPVSPSATGSDEYSLVQNILLDADIDASSYRIGISQIFFRSSVLTRLEAQRDDKLADLIVRLQSQCRGYLSRKRFEKLKIEDIAVRCIQRNVRKFMSIRNWPWWRLLVKVTPLLDVHRTEQELKIKTEELEVLRSQLQKLEQERNLLKQENMRLDSKLSETTVDLAEERSTATLTGERLELEMGEKVRIENELQHVQNENKKLQETTERLETELCLKSAADMNGLMISSSFDDDELTVSSDGEAVYKQRYERVARELEFTKRRLQQQHHDDLEQLIGLRKQLEKKLSDAYEEVEEQRQVVAQWKRKVQKLTAEMNDMRLLLEDSNSRNNLLEKKQRKFDSELLLLHDELRQEKQIRERINREKDVILSEKYTIEQNLSAAKLDAELKEQKLSNLTKELQEISFGGNTEEEVAKLRKAKHDLEHKVAEQEEELDDLAGQLQLLEQSKVRLEMSLEQQRKEHRKELSQRDEETDDIRCNTTKKVKALECQLENEHEERTLLLRERHELERRLAESEERERSGRTTDHDLINRLKRDLKKTKVLLHDSQLMLQRAKTDAPNKALLRQLRNQLEDAECARNAALKARQALESELADANASLEDVQRARNDAEDRAAMYAREKTQLQSQLDENEEELAEVLKKYRYTVQQLSNEQLTLHEQANRIAELENERASLKEQVAEITSRLETIETHGDPSSSLAVKRFELKTKELESRLELEQTTRSRMEVQINRLKDAAERFQQEANTARSKEALAQDNVRKLQRSLRETKEMQTDFEQKETNEIAKRRELEKQLEQTKSDFSTAKADLKLALQRIDDLQAAIQGELDDHDVDDDENGDEHSDSDNDSLSSDNSLQSFITQTSAVNRWLNGTASNKSDSTL